MKNLTNIAKSKGYATFDNAKKKLEKELEACGFDRVNYLIAVNEEGRFVPVVMHNNDPMITVLVHHGITVVG